MKYIVISVCWLSLWIVQILSSDDERPVVDTPSGQYRGHILKTRNGRDVLAFQGIPYALPPIGELRFKDPVKSNKLDDIYDASNEFKECFQPGMDFTQMNNISAYIGSEDCLYLNVYVPKVAEGTGPLPVLVWIHGGGYMVGSGSTFWQGPEFLLDRDMIMVTLNYRLGILGFFSTGDSILPGNLGMKDQVIALEWVKENIASFGGDPGVVTIGGVSAGASAAALQMHSPLSKGLFKRVIAQSGTAYSAFGINTMENARKSAEKVASFLGCSLDRQHLVKCLRKMPLHQLFEASQSVMVDGTVFFLNFYPVIEEENPGSFITENSFIEPSQYALIAGVTSNECMYSAQEYAALSLKYANDVNKALEDIDNLLPKVGFYQNHPMKDEITRKLLQFYSNQKTPTELEFSKLCSDILHNHGLHLTARKAKGPSYIYKFSYKRAKELRPPPKGLEDDVSHAEECMYLFNTKYFQTSEGWSKEDTEFSNKISDIWYNFISSGDPTPDSKLWRESERGIKYLDFTNEGLHMKSNMFESRMQFLDQLDIDISIPMNLLKHDEL